MKQSNILFKSVLFLLCILTLSTSAPSKRYALNISNDSIFTNYSSLPLSAKYGSISSLKLLYDISNDTLYYLSSDFKYHFIFCKEILNYKYKLKIFNKFNYLPSKERSYVCANINRIANTDKYFIDFSVGETISQKMLSILITKIKSTFIPEAKLSILANTSSIRDSTVLIQDSTDILTPDILFKEQPYQIIQTGVSSGILSLDTNYVIDDYPRIMILTKTINNPIPAEGYISPNFITPLSHIAMLTHSNKTPTITITNNDTINKYLNKPIKLIISKTGYTISLLDTINEKGKSSKKNKLVKLKISKTKKVLIPIKEISIKDVSLVGAKAANLAELYSISYKTGFKIPEDGAVIPFSAYLEHINTCGLKKKIEDLNELTDIENIKKNLKDIRQIIKSTPISPILKEEVYKHLKKSKFENFRFRSSSNAEDLKDFSGAGLYNSLTGTLSKDIKPYNFAIKKVWASLWSEQAFFQRRKSNIDQSSAVMAVLIHRGFPEEEINGVVITKNIYREDSPVGYTLTMQKGDLSVVDINSSHNPELSISYFDNFSEFYNRLNAVDYIVYSSLSSKPLLEMDDMKKITRVFRIVKNHFYKTWKISTAIEEFAADIEFKIDEDINGKRCLYLKQSRPY